jgi:ubiquinone/menaquinone biosynthesis C-methylase UbiE
MDARDDSSRHPDYDSIAGTYDRRYIDNDYSGVEQALIAFIGQTFGGAVVEVGCGTGRWLRLLAERGVRSAGVDASKNMLDFARAQAAGALLAQGRAESLPWADGAFDRLFCINAFHHFEDKAAFLSEARRVLVPGGRMMTIGLDPHTGLDRWYVYEYFEPALDIDRRRYPAAAHIREWLRDLEFTDVGTAEVQHLPDRMPVRTAIQRGRLDKHDKSQLAVLTDREYQQGMDRIREALERAEARGETLTLTADLRMYATFGTAPSR